MIEFLFSKRKVWAKWVAKNGNWKFKDHRKSDYALELRVVKKCLKPSYCLDLVTRDFNCCFYVSTRTIRNVACPTVDCFW